MKNYLILCFLLVASTVFSQNYFYALDEEPIPDNENPTAPLDLVVSHTAYTTADFLWTAATDNVAVKNYKVLIYDSNDVLLKSTTIANINNYTEIDLLPDTVYFVTVRALDAAFNESVDSNKVAFTTKAYGPNLIDEEEYYGCYLLPLSQKDQLQEALDTYGCVRLEAGDYGYNASGNSITMSSNQKLYGDVRATRVPDINIAAGSSGVILKDLEAFYVTLEAGAPITNCYIESIRNGVLRTTGGQIENNVFVDIKNRLWVYCDTSGYFRNNEIYRHAFGGVTPRFVIKGNDATPSYGNVHVWGNNLTPLANGMDISNLDDITLIGYDVEAWQWKGENDWATVYMRDMGTVKMLDTGGGAAGYLPDENQTPAFDIEADNLEIYNWGLAAEYDQRFNILRNNTNFYSVDYFKGETTRIGNTEDVFDLRINYNNNWNSDDDPYRIISLDTTGVETEITNAISSGSDYTNLKASILGIQKTPIARTTFEDLPDPLGANWREERIGKPDSYAYIQNLIDTNDVAELPEGVFYISQTLFVGHNQGIIGQGTGKTVICGLTDDFELVETYSLPREGSDGTIIKVTLSHLTLQGGYAGWRIKNNVNRPGVGTMINEANIKYVIFREQTYGILHKDAFGIDNNFFNQVHFVGCDIGFFQDASGFDAWDLSTSNYVDKVMFWKSQFINNTTMGVSMKSARANNLNSWTNCLFKGNGIAWNGSTNYLQFVNCDFTEHTGDWTLGFGDMSVINCNFWNNSTTSIFNAKNARVFGSTLSDNIPLFSKSQHSFLDFLLVNSDITGTIGDFTEGTSINTSIPNSPKWNKLLVRQRRDEAIEPIIDEAPNPYPQLFAKGDLVPIDDIPPTAPTNFTASDIYATQVYLTWGASTDNKRVTFYKIYNNGVEIASINSNLTNYNLIELTPETTYNLTIRAFDYVGNESIDSNIETFTTPALSGSLVSSIYIEAEDMIKTGDWQTITDANASNGQAIQMIISNNPFTTIPSTEQLTHIVSTDLNLESGVYKIWIRYKAAVGTYDSVFVKFNNEDWILNKGANNPQFYVWGEVLSGTYNLSDGVHILKIVPREGMTIDRIYITKNNDSPI